MFTSIGCYESSKTSSSTKAGGYHELALYFLIRFPPGSTLLEAAAFDRTDGGVALRFKWFPIRREELVALPLLPAFLPQGLTDLPLSVVHIVHRDAVPPPLVAPA
jgi:hypothetical protein